MANWDHRFLYLARHLSGWSKDPSTKVGAVIVRPDKTVASVGFNGFPRGVQDTHERLGDRESKLDLIVHAEINALAFAKESLQFCTLYVWPMPPCVRCATSIIQHGITRVVCPEPVAGSRWWDSVWHGRRIMEEAGVVVEWLPVDQWSTGDTE